MGIKRWVMRRGNPEQSQELQEKTGLPPLVCDILVARNCDTIQAVEAFFDNSQQLEDPFVLRDMDRAVARIQEALEDGERIAVYGDYDCDGITATALLVSYLQSVGADVIYYVPNRENEGYGLNRKAVEVLSGQGVELIVTVDNGVSAVDEIAYATTLSMDVVVTDHHTPPAVLPAAVAVVNPHRADCPSAFKHLAGVGVAFKLVCALEGDSGEEMMEYYSELVALGTVADVMPLTHENRILVRHGLERLTQTHNVGIGALLEVSGLAGTELSSESAAFGLIPRINASGRMGIADNAIELLLTDSHSYAMELAEEIDNQNAQRKATEAKILAEIEGELANNPHLLHQPILVVQGSGWHHGVVGIVSARLMEKYGKPCIVFSKDNTEARGSGRSLEGFSLIQAIRSCKEHLTKYGGHTLAAGMSLPTQKLDQFVQQLQAYAAQQAPQMPQPKLEIDCELPPSLLQVPAIDQLAALEPFGAGNAVPVFCIARAAIEGIYPVGSGKHLRLKLGLGAQTVFAVYFGVSQDIFPFQTGDVVDIVANVSVNVYNGERRLSIKIKDVRPAGLQQDSLLASARRYEAFCRSGLEQEEKNLLVPTRNDLAAVYKYIRNCKTYMGDAQGLFFALHQSGIDYGRMCIAIDMLEEAQLLRYVRQSGKCAIQAVQSPQKADLEQTSILKRLKG